MEIKGPKLLKNFLNIFPDDRGYLNTFSYREMLEIEEIYDFNFQYQLMSFTENINTFRGFHFQIDPFQQTKIIIVHKGTIFDYIFPYDAPYKQNISKFQLSRGDALVIPCNYAHGFLTKSKGVLIQYLMDCEYSSSSYKGINGFNFISEVSNQSNILISDKDKNLPELLY